MILTYVIRHALILTCSGSSSDVYVMIGSSSDVHIMIGSYYDTHTDALTSFLRCPLYPGNTAVSDVSQRFLVICIGGAISAEAPQHHSPVGTAAQESRRQARVLDWKEAEAESCTMSPRTLFLSLLIVYCVLAESYGLETRNVTSEVLDGKVSRKHKESKGVDCKAAVANLNVTVKGVRTAKDARRDAVVMMKPVAKLEEFLVAAPRSIAVLADLAQLSSTHEDSAIHLQPPKGGFKYMKYPESFSASLMQVSNATWSAFNTANKNMDQIRLWSASIPKATVNIVHVLFLKSSMVNTLLPRQLKRLLGVSQKCTSLARSVGAGFRSANHLTQEVIEAYRNSRKASKMTRSNLNNTLVNVTVRAEASNKSSVYPKHSLKKLVTVFKQSMGQVPSMRNSTALNLLRQSINDLVETVKTVQHGHNYTSNVSVKDLLYHQAAKVSDIANLVHMITATYCEVSQRYLMDHVSALGRFTGMSPSNPAFQEEHQKLQTGIRKDQDAIKKIITAKKKMFESNVQARVHWINCQLGAAFPYTSTGVAQTIPATTVAMPGKPDS
ncbi:hypothetical protein NDU88_000276 [Pleurodeles waltl]|uniref:Uncharacterized protein n=1 Tax=Pleurodeles waltl TaxID=8319 RepID=A0AAV7WIY3_PLEWA|nr:hypothetical protein NDU88_000276 [Pleurodeles waltl]